MNTHIHNTTASFSLREARLCGRQVESVGQLQETMEGDKELRNNPHLRAALERYNKLIAVKYDKEFPVNSPERSFVLSMLLHYMTADAKGEAPNSYKDFTRGGIHLSDPFKRKTALLVNLGNATLAGDEKKKVENQKEIAEIDKATTDWNGDKYVDDAVLQKTIDVYLGWKRPLDALLKSKNVRIPQNEALEGPGGRSVLSRDQYFSLLLIVSEGGLQDIEKELQKGNDPTASILAFLEQKPVKEQVEPAQKAYRKLTINERGPAEALANFGIQLGPIVRARYFAVRNGTAKSPHLVAGESAASWEKDPWKAYLFLTEKESGVDASLGPNIQFLDAFKYYFDPATQNEPKAAEYGPKGKEMSKEDVIAGLRLIIRTLSEQDAVLTASAQARNALRNDKDITQKIEDIGGKTWEYIKEYRDHPIGSALIAIGGFLILRGLWRFLKKEHYNITNYAVLAGFAGLSVGLLQKNMTGKAWWESAGNKMKRWMGKEGDIDREDATMANYWTKMELKIDDQQKTNCMLLMEKQSASTVMDWYARYSQSNHSKGAGDNTPLGPGLQFPFPKGQEALRFKNFGNSSDARVSRLMYETLRAFFVNRGQAAVQSNLWDDPGENEEARASIGYSYIRQKYLTATPFTRLLSTGTTTTYGTPPILARTTVRGGIPTGSTVSLGPSSVRGPAVAVEQPVNYADASMWQIFYLESNPEMISRMGKQGAEYGSVLAELNYRAREIADSAIDGSAKILEIGGEKFVVVYDATKNMWVAAKEGAKKGIDATGEGIVYAWDATKGWVDKTGRSIMGPNPGPAPDPRETPVFKDKKQQLLALTPPINARFQGTAADKVQVGFSKDPSNAATSPLLYPVTLSLTDFTNDTSAQIKEKYLSAAVTLRKREIEAGATNPPEQGMKVERNGENISIHVDPNEKSISPVEDVLRTPNSIIYDKYNKWMNDRNTGVSAAQTQPDALKYN